MKIFGNWLQLYFRDKPSAAEFVDPYAWINEKSIFENKLEQKNTRSANAQIIYVTDLNEIMGRNDCENYLAQLISLFNSRQLQFENPIQDNIENIILDKFNSNRSWKDSFNSYLQIPPSSPIDSSPHPSGQMPMVREVETDATQIMQSSSRLKSTFADLKSKKKRSLET